MAAPIKCVGRLLFSMKNVQENIVIRKHVPIYQCASRCLSGTTSAVDESVNEQTQKINRAMKMYLERAKGHQKFMQEEIAEYEIGKRHLANIMSADPDNFTQDDINKAIEYLLPSGLFDRKARPLFKHPEDIIPKRKVAQFGMDGRPFHYMFYTMSPNYYEIMHECAMKIEALKEYDDAMFRQREPLPEDGARVSLVGSAWLEKVRMQKLVGDSITGPDYLRLVGILERLASLPYSIHEEDFIMKFRVKLRSKAMFDNIPPLTVDEGVGRSYADGNAIRKSATAQVRVWGNGKGKVTVNGQSFVEFFPEITDRQQVMYPLQFTQKLMDLDLEATVEGGGPSGRAGAIRLATARALQSFVEPDIREQMRLAGLLTTDPRMKERNKPGQKKARKKFTWKKR